MNKKDNCCYINIGTNVFLLELHLNIKISDSMLVQKKAKTVGTVLKYLPLLSAPCALREQQDSAEEPAAI